MEAVERFLSVGSGDGSGDGDGYGTGSSGYGSGTGTGSASCSGYGSGTGSSGYGYGSGSGTGSSGDGSGYGYGSSSSGYGTGYGTGTGDGISSLNGHPIHIIDGVQTLITRVKGGIAKGFILNADLTLRACFVAKREECFAHGDTVESAVREAESKLLDKSPIEDRIAMFRERFNRKDKYPASEFFVWHRTLTGSCEMGRTQFMQDKGIGMDDKFTVAEFVTLTKNVYGGDVIQMLTAEGPQE